MSTRNRGRQSAHVYLDAAGAARHAGPASAPGIGRPRDIPKALAAVALLKSLFHGLKIRFVNVVDLFTLVPPAVHPHGLPDEAFDALFTADKPVIFNFHGYPR